MKKDFIIALNNLSKSVELNSQRTDSGHFKLHSKDEIKTINKLRGGMKKAYDISIKLKAIDRLTDLNFLLENPDPILVTYYCKFNYPNYAEIFVPILAKIYNDIQSGPLKVEVGMALDEFNRLLLNR